MHRGLPELGKGKGCFAAQTPFSLPGCGENWRGLPLCQDRACVSTPHHPWHPAGKWHGVFPKLLLTSIKENSLQPGWVCTGKGLRGATALPKASHHRFVGSATNKLLFELCPASKGWKSPAVLSRGADATRGALPWKAETIKHVWAKFTFSSKSFTRGSRELHSIGMLNHLPPQWKSTPSPSPKHGAGFISSCKTLHFSIN